MDMTLQEYVEKRGRGSVAKLVRDSGISRSTLERALAGYAVTVETAKAITEATGGKVSARALVGL